MKTSQSWWPADYGNYGPYLLEWHGTALELIARLTVVAALVVANKGFEPLNSWPDNVSLDKARRLLLANQTKIRSQPFLGRFNCFVWNCRLRINGF